MKCYENSKHENGKKCLITMEDKYYVSELAITDNLFNHCIARFLHCAQLTYIDCHGGSPVGKYFFNVGGEKKLVSQNMGAFSLHSCKSHKYVEDYGIALA